MPDARFVPIDERVSRLVATLAAACLVLGCRTESGRPSDTELATTRLACGFGKGATASETIGRQYPVGKAIPIDHFFVFMQENRSFDHYFGTMPGVDGLTASSANPDGAGGSVSAFHATEYCFPDVEHGWDGTHDEWNGGANDGFVTANAPNGGRSMGYLDATDLPYYHALFATFAMSDRHFCSMLGPTWVNRMYLASATSFGLVDNMAVPDDRLDAYGDDPYTVYQQLDAAGASWRVYYSDVATIWGIYPELGFSMIDHFRPFTQLAADLAAGDVVDVTYVEPAFYDSGSVYERNDEHPPTNPQKGQIWVAARIGEIMNSGAWPRSAIILTYDEHGGFHDHVPPPPACEPDGFDMVYGDLSPVTNFRFDRLGIRVPLTVISPFAKRGYVSHVPTDHTSILRLLQARFGLPAMTRRDANAWPLLDMFDFAHPDLSVPALPTPTVDAAHEAACNAAGY